jgi:dihydrolipoamide dehydrogenase
MQEDGIELVLNSTVSKIEKIGDSRLKVYVNSTEKGELTFEVDKVLVAVGAVPNSRNLGLENTKVRIDENGFISVDAQMRTTDPKIFAIGDVARKPMLAHKATKEGKVAADVIAGKNVKFDNVCIPNVIFSDPELAVAGMSEKDAREKGIEINVGKFPFSALGRARIERETKGFVKIIEEKKSGKILGVVIIGIDASNMISEAALAIEKGMKTDDLINTIHPHPTLPESIMEAAEDVRKAAIHIAQL